MALATRCPHCKTTFRVAADQLKLRGGIVRCGTCSQVFDGNAALVELDAIKPRASVAPALPLVPVVPLEEQGETAGQTIMAQELTEVETPAPVAAAKPAYVLDYDLSEPVALDFDLSEPAVKPEVELGPQPEPEQQWAEAPLDAADEAPLVEVPPEPEAVVADAAADEVPEAVANEAVADAIVEVAHDSEPSLELELDPSVLDEQAGMSAPRAEEPEDWPSPQALEHTPHPDLEFGPLPLVRESAPAPEPEESVVAAPEPVRLTRPVRADFVPAPPPPPPEHDEPDFVRLHREKEANARRRRLTLGGASAVLTLILLAQVVSNFRDTLAAQYPGARPILASTCKMLGCRIMLPAQIEQLSIETGELQSLSGTSFQLTTLLSNEGSLVQAWPHIELELTDTRDKAVVRRVFTPAQYLPAPALAAKGFAGKSEQPVKIQFELRQVKASGFHIAVFYP